MEKLNKIAAIFICAIIPMLSIGLIFSISGKSEGYLKSRSVQLVGHPSGSCSGQQIKAPSGIDYIITAAHCKVLAVGDSITVITEQGLSLERRVIAEDTNSDLLLIEGLPSMSGLSIADSSHRSEHIRTFTHGSAFQTYKTEGEIIQDAEINILLGIVQSEDQCKATQKTKMITVPTEFGMINLCLLSMQETVITALVVPGSSGGMVVNDSGELLGVVSATDGKFGYTVRLSDIKLFLAGY